MNAISDTSQQLWNNAQDSLRHAYAHSAASDRSGESDWHHQKWMVLSIHHAAGCLANMWLHEYNPSSNLIAGDKFPFLVPALKEIAATCKNYFKPTELEFMSMCENLNTLRNEFYHRCPPEKLTTCQISELIMVFAGFIRIIERRDLAPILINEFKENFADIIEEIDYESYPSYTRLIEELIHDKDTYFEIEDCPVCGAHAVFQRECQACFRCIETIDCDLCGYTYQKSNELNEPDFCPICIVRATLDNN